MHFGLDFFKNIFFTEDHVTEEQSDLGPYCLQYKLLKNINSKIKEHQRTRGADEKRLYNGSLGKKS